MLTFLYVWGGLSILAAIIFFKARYNLSRGGAARSAHLPHKQEVGGSNPPPATNFPAKGKKPQTRSGHVLGRDATEVEAGEPGLQLSVLPGHSGKGGGCGDEPRRPEKLTAGNAGSPPVSDSPFLFPWEKARLKPEVPRCPRCDSPLGTYDWEANQCHVCCYELC